MRTDIIMLIIVTLVGIDKAEPVQCSCSEIQVELDCRLMYYGCSWDVVSETCSELACHERTSDSCVGTLYSYANDCEVYEGKCQNRKATCVEHEYEKNLYDLCKPAREGQCQLDTAAGSNKCKKFDTPITCASYDGFQCNYLWSLESSSSTFGYCYFDESKAGTDANPQCLDLPNECSERTEFSCVSATFVQVQCVWKNAKCQVKTCADLKEEECIVNHKGNFKMQWCEMIGGKCQEVDLSKLNMIECLSKSFVTYHYDGSSCQPCKGLDSFLKYSLRSLMSLILVMIY